MKKLPWILIVLLAIACIVVWFRPHEQPPAEVRVETKIKTLHRRQVVYSDSSYRAVVSGYVDPRLDSMTVYPRTVYQTVTNDIYHPVVVKPKRKRWGLGLQVGYGYPGGFYVGGGVSYNLFMW